MELNSVHFLKKEVEKLFGRRLLSSFDCQCLCDDIFKMSRLRVSFNTIRRVFNLIQDGGKPSVYTLDALSNYCGFASFDVFVVERQLDFKNKHGRQEQILLSFLVSFFKKIKFNKKNDYTYQNLIKQAILHIEKHPSIIDPFLKEIAKTKNGQQFFFERFVSIDKLNSYYGHGLHYYLKAKKTKEAQVFGHSLLCHQKWLNDDKEGVEKYYRKVVQQDFDKTISHSVNARYFSTQLFYYNFFNLDEAAVLIEARTFYNLINQWEENYLYPTCFEIIVSEALILTSRYDEALFYIEELFARCRKNRRYHIDISLYESARLLQAIVLANTGEKYNSLKILRAINPNRFSFLTKQYFSILYLSIKQNIKNNLLEQAQIEHLVLETGFMKLTGIWQDNYLAINRKLKLT